MFILHYQLFFHGLNGALGSLIIQRVDTKRAYASADHCTQSIMGHRAQDQCCRNEGLLYVEVMLRETSLLKSDEFALCVRALCDLLLRSLTNDLE
jgi:hypothetical protein